MGQLRDRNAVLMPNEIEAIKVTQEVIKRMADNSAKTKTVFLDSSGICVGSSSPDFGQREPVNKYGESPR